MQRRTTDSVALSRALATEGQSVDIEWGADFADLKTSVATYDARAHKLADRLCVSNREKHELRAIEINRSQLGVQVYLWADAERVAAPLIAGIKDKVGNDHALYVGVTKLKKGSYGYIREAFASMIDEDRNPVIFPLNEAHQRFGVEQLIDDLQFQVEELHSSTQYCDVRKLETCIHAALHGHPGRLWFGRGCGKYLDKLIDVKSQIDSGSASSLFLIYAPKHKLVEHKVRVRANMPDLRAFLNH